MTDEMKIFLETPVEKITCWVIRKAAASYIEEYKNLPGGAYGRMTTMDDLDIKYSAGKREFAEKYLDFADKCRELEKLGYSNDWEVRVAIQDAKRYLYTFPWGWIDSYRLKHLREMREMK